jgi:hypothetical protein
MKAETLLYIGGAFHLIWVVFDLLWPKLFNWKETLAPLDDLQRVLLPIASKLLVLIYLGIAYVSFLHTSDLMNTDLGRALLLFITAYWAVRAILQVRYIGFDKANEFNVSFSSLAPFFPYNRMSNRAFSYYLMTIFIITMALYSIPLIHT